jgi:hypothetical protein
MDKALCAALISAEYSPDISICAKTKLRHSMGVPFCYVTQLVANAVTVE